MASSTAVQPSGAAELALPTVRITLLSRAVAGALFMFSSLFSILALYVPLVPTFLYCYCFDRQRRRGCDWIVQYWAKCSLKLIGARIEVEGTEHLPPADEAVLYAPNHCSFLDIFALSAYLPRRFKYISKIEILRIPLIGWAMGFANHIAIKRTDRASQLATFKEAVACLQGGSSLVTFPEGTRSKDGRIMDFKKGPFTMASRAKVRVVPISIVGTHLFQPPGAFLPFAIPRGVRLVVHPPLDPPQNKKEAETLQVAKAAVMSGLPAEMQPAAAA